MVFFNTGIRFSSIDCLVEFEDIKACLILFFEGFRQLRIHSESIVAISDAVFESVEVEIADGSVGIE